MQSKHVKTLALLALAGVLGMVSASSAFAQKDDDDRGLAGSWLFQISIQDCNSGAPLGQPFQSLLTFAKGGTLTESTSNPMFFPAERGPGHGVWRHHGSNTYIATSTAFITMNGVLARTQTITQTIEVLTDDTLATTGASVMFYKPDGTLLASGCAAATGTRIELPGE